MAEQISKPNFIVSGHKYEAPTYAEDRVLMELLLIDGTKGISELTDRLNTKFEASLATTTVSTYLRRLRDKGYVKLLTNNYRSHRKWTWVSLVSKEDYIEAQRKLFKKLYGENL